MRTIFERLDEFAGFRERRASLLWLRRAAFVFLVLMVVAAPHSIAATQAAWITGMFLWLVADAAARIAGARGTDERKDRVLRFARPLTYALWAFFVWSALTSFTSYAPDISIDKLRGVAVFLIFVFVVHAVRRVRVAHLLGAALVTSCMVNVVWVPVERLIGRGVEIRGLASDGPLAKALLWEGDTLLEANGKKLANPEDVLATVTQNEVTKVKFYRPDFDFVVEVKRADLLAGNTAAEQLGFTSWRKSRNWRSSGFYGHYTTYAEVLQLIASLVLGVLAAFLAAYLRHGRSRSRNIRNLLVLLFVLAAMSLALLLTVTRASQLAFLLSAALIVVVGLGRKWLLRAALIAIPVAIAGLFFLQQSRQVGFFDPRDDSIKWRQTVWREGVELWTASPRNLIVGVGMDSIKRYWREWDLFDKGRLNIGHFHSTPLQLVVERGAPALLLWILILWIYARILLRGLRALPLETDSDEDTLSRGFLLGCLGGTLGFAASSLVHYNLGDQEVAMIFFLLMGLATVIASGVKAGNAAAESRAPV